MSVCWMVLGLSIGWLVSWSVMICCPEVRKVKLACSYRSTCFILCVSHVFLVVVRKIVQLIIKPLLQFFLQPTRLGIFGFEANLAKFTIFRRIKMPNLIVSHVETDDFFCQAQALRFDLEIV